MPFQIKQEINTMKELYCMTYIYQYIIFKHNDLKFKKKKKHEIFTQVTKINLT